MNTSYKIKTFSQLQDIIKTCREKGEAIVTTNGCFNTLHWGHISYLEKASQFGENLIVLVNGDDSVTSLKGVGHLKNSAIIRAKSLAALDCVECVCIFDDVTPSKLLEQIKPDVHVKGKDYELLPLPEREVVEHNGGRIELVEFIPYYTTIDKIKFFTEN